MRLPWSKKPSVDIEFVDVSRSIYQSLPIHEASKVPLVCKQFQVDKHGASKFMHCPGMYDYSKLGYIIPAHTDIRIIANKAGVSSMIGSAHRGSRGFATPVKMEKEIVEGFFTPEDGVPLEVVKVGMPWNIFTNSNISAMLLPPVYHATYLDDLHVWPGIVDYEDFSTCNFIFSAKQKCNITIKAGEPLLHVIPVFNKEFTAGFGPGSDAQIDSTNNQIPGDDSQYYRKNFLVKKVYQLLKGG